MVKMKAFACVLIIAFLAPVAGIGLEYTAAFGSRSLRNRRHAISQAWGRRQGGRYG